MLTEQYRMHPAICSFVSTCIYDGAVTTAPCLQESRLNPNPCVWLESKSPEVKHEHKVSSIFVQLHVILVYALRCVMS